MNNKIVSVIFFISLLGLASFVCLPAGKALAQVTIPNPLGETSTFSGLLLKISAAVGELIATLGTLMIIIAGILYATSAGSPEGVNKAKTALTYAIAGIIIGLAASGIVTLIGTILGISI